MIFDCFTFFNELDLLDIRLHTLDKFVDRFVISEADMTFQGGEKPFVYHENRHLFSKFKDRIIWVPCRWRGRTTGWTAWEREFHQRRRLRTHLMVEELAKPEDILLLSDVDEIPDLGAPVQGTLKYWQELAREGQPVVWIQHLTYYWVNWYASEWAGTVAMTMAAIDKVCNGDMELVRRCRGDRRNLVSPGGWHFSWLGGTDAIQTKLSAFSHTELLSFNTKENIEAKTAAGADLFDRKIYNFRELTAQEYAHLPAYLVNTERFRQYFRGDHETRRSASTA